MITKQTLQQCLPRNKNIDQLYEVLLPLLDKYQINTNARIAAFLAQVGHESADFTILAENLNYKAQRLVQIFPKYFPDLATASLYERNPKKIANRVYGNRMGNGPESSGDGFKFRGRGAIQLTGCENYTAYAKSIGKTIDETVAYCETLQGAVESACWYWDSRKLNNIADSKDMTLLTKRINGGKIGLEERIHHYNRILALLEANA